MDKLPIIFIDHGDTAALRLSLESFLSMNACALPRLRIIVLTCKPPTSTTTMLDSFQKQIDRLIVRSKTFHWLAVFQTLQTLKTPYVILLPPGWDSHAPLHPYLDQLSDTLSAYPHVGMIKLTRDTGTLNDITGDPIVYHHVSSSVLIGNGNIQFDVPIMLRTDRPKSGKFYVGKLKSKPEVFRRLPEGSPKCQ